MKYDVVVVGAGPAGTCAARFAATGGARTLLIEKKRDVGYPVVCGEYLPGREEMARLLPHVPWVRDLFTLPREVVSRQLPQIDLVAPSGLHFALPFDGMSVERFLFERHLAVEATRAGAEIMVNTEFRSLRDGKTVVARHRGRDLEIEAKAVIGCDGPSSPVALAAGLERPRGLAPCVAYEVAGDFPPITELYFGQVAPGGYAWVIPKRETCNVGLGVQQGWNEGDLRALLAKFVAKVSGENMGVYFTSGAVPMEGPSERTVAGRVLLAGDSAGHVMACNGGGIPIAMICGRIAGETAAEHVARGTPLADYEKRWRFAVEKLLDNCLLTKRLGEMGLKSDILLEMVMRSFGAADRFLQAFGRDGFMVRGLTGQSLLGV
ncbi:MAG: NAD(P)/FAD-dependent oxidoreductase [Halobacteria archaeon]